MSKPFGEHQLVAFQFSDFVFIASDDSRVRCVHDSRQQGLNLLFDSLYLTMARPDDLGCLGAALFPCSGKHGTRDCEQGLRRFELADQLAHIVFQPLARDRFAVATTSCGLTEVIGIGLGAPRTPGRAQRDAAIGTDRHAAKGEIVADVLAQRRLGGAVAAGLHLVERCERNQRLMMALEPVDAIGLAADVAGIKRLRQDFGHALLRENAFDVARKIREALEEALDLRLGLEPPHGVALEGVSHDRREGLIRHQNLAPAPDGLVPVANGCHMDPIARLHARRHLLRDLTAILLALQRALRGHDGFDELAFGTVVEFEVQALDPGKTLAEGVAQVEMETGVAGKPLQIVEDHGEGLARLRVEKAQKRDHARALHEVSPAADRIRKDGYDLVTLVRSVLAAAMLLAVEAVPIFFLRLR